METLLAMLMFYQVNLYRVNMGFPKVVEDPVACAIAQYRLEQIKSDFSHDEFIPVIKVLNMKADFYENLGYGDKNNPNINSQEMIFENWKKSPSHNENLLKNIDGICFRTDGVNWVMEGINHKF